MGKTLAPPKDTKEKHEYRTKKKKEQRELDDEWFKEELTELSNTRRRDDEVS